MNSGIARGIWPCLLILILVTACQKYSDNPGKTDPRLVRPYCNVPEAVNYNWDFPGTPDSTVCYYPSDVFKGHYLFNDSIYSGSNELVLQQPLSFNIYAITRSKIGIVGFCTGSPDTLRLTASRTFRAQVDTTILNGQPLCRIQDTLSGFILSTTGDTAKLHFNFTVVSDTGVIYHRGTAVKQ